MLKFVLLSSQGDPYYIGLNGIEIYDDSGRLIELSEDQLQAAPYRSSISSFLPTHLTPPPPRAGMSTTSPRFGSEALTLAACRT
jgi:hypothetical protein